MNAHKYARYQAQCSIFNYADECFLAVFINMARIIVERMRHSLHVDKLHAISLHISFPGRIRAFPNTAARSPLLRLLPAGLTISSCLCLLIILALSSAADYFAIAKFHRTAYRPSSSQLRIAEGADMMRACMFVKIMLK